ncbi:hypothetical protein ACQP1V_17825 [Microtetraspora malaysiensis]|uniref:hypothetical protein n=1 Tax=Microtetraspora malaysiensis TaxID=161358 RepID=UPI003D925822
MRLEPCTSWCPHRRTVLDQADHIVVMARGRVEAQGSLAEVLETSPEMRMLWSGTTEERQGDAAP